MVPHDMKKKYVLLTLVQPLNQDIVFCPAKFLDER